MTLTITDAGLDELADAGFDPVYGARPLKRAIQRELETVVAQAILKGNFKDGDAILVTTDEDGTLIVQNEASGQTMTSTRKKVQPPPTNGEERKKKKKLREDAVDVDAVDMNA